MNGHQEVLLVRMLVPTTPHGPVRFRTIPLPRSGRRRSRTDGLTGISICQEFQSSVVSRTTKVSDLAERVEELAERVSRLEGRRKDPAHLDTSLVRELIADLKGDGDGEPGAGAVVYAGAGPWGEGTVALEIVRGWDDVLDASEEALARVMSALANPTRIRIVGELLEGPVSTGELAERLEQPSAGQLFHHLKELLAAGIIHQPVRGTYAIGDRHVIPLLVLGSAAIDLSIPTQEEPS